jgi:hypothetical protein
MAPKKPVKPTKLQVKANQGNKVLTGPKGSKPQSTTTNRVRTQGGTTMSKPKPAAKPKPPAKPPVKPPAKPPAKPNSRTLANQRLQLPNSTQAGRPLVREGAADYRNRAQGPTLKGSKPPTRGGALVRQGNAKPENPRRTSARNRQATAGRGTTGPNRTGQPAGSANRMFGANRVNQAVNRAVTQNTLRQAMRGGTGASIVGALLNAPEELKKLQALLRNPKGALSRASSDILSGKAYNPETVKTAKPKPNTNRPNLYENAYDTRAPRSAYGLKDNPTPKPPAKPKPPAAAPSTRASAPSRSSAPASRPAASAPARTPSRPATSRPSTPKPPSAPSAPKVAGTSGIGPVKSGAEYGRRIGASTGIGPVKSGEEYGRMIGAPKASSSSSSAPATKKKSSALSQAEIRKRRLNR